MYAFIRLPFVVGVTLGFIPVFVRSPGCHETKLNQNCHLLSSECDLGMQVQIGGIAFHKNWKQTPIFDVFLKTSQLNGNFLSE